MKQQLFYMIFYMNLLDAQCECDLLCEFDKAINSMWYLYNMC